MSKAFKSLLLLSLVCLIGVSAHAGVVGDIKVCYFCANNFGTLPAFQDGPTFLIENTSATAITGISFVANGDAFALGTINAGSNFILQPGLSNDGGGGHTFWAFTGTLLDTSESGPTANSTPFSLTGLSGGLAVQSMDLCGLAQPMFTPNCTSGPSNDKTTTTNFIGLNDSPCGDCFGQTVVANLVTVTSTGVPEPSTWVLLGSAGVLIGAVRRRRFFGPRRNR